MKICTLWFGVMVGMVGLVEVSHGANSVTGAAMVSAILDGSVKLAELIRRLNTMFLKPITDRVNNEIAKIDTQMQGLRHDERKMVEDSRITLVNCRHDIQRARAILTVLADETITRSKPMLNILNIILTDSSTAVKQQKSISLAVEQMKKLLERSKELLRSATEKYEQSQLKLKIVQEKLRIFSSRVSQLANTKSQRHKNEAGNLRKKVYLGVMAGCAFPLACPFIYATAAGVVESKIKAWRNRVNGAVRECGNIVWHANQLVQNLSSDIIYLKNEERVIMTWDSKIALMYDDYKDGDFVQNAIDMNEFIKGHSVNQISDLIAACQEFKKQSGKISWI